jgi:hypothetical protein
VADNIKRKTVNITFGQDAFLKRKTEDIRKMMPPGEEGRVTESTVLQGLLNFWMAVDSGDRKDVPAITHKD